MQLSFHSIILMVNRTLLPPSPPCFKCFHGSGMFFLQKSLKAAEMLSDPPGAPLSLPLLLTRTNKCSEVNREGSISDFKPDKISDVPQSPTDDPEWRRWLERCCRHSMDLRGPPRTPNVLLAQKHPFIS